MHSASTCCDALRDARSDARYGDTPRLPAARDWNDAPEDTIAERWQADHAAQIVDERYAGWRDDA